MDGRAAVEAVARGHFDLALMGLRMPDMDGLEAIRRIRALSAGKELPIVALTAGEEILDRQACLDAGADAFLTKPIDGDALYRLIADLAGPSSPSSSQASTMSTAPARSPSPLRL